MPHNWTREQVLRMHRLYEEDVWPLELVGALFGISHETVRKLFKREKLPIRPRRESSTSAIRNMLAATDQFEDIVQAYKRLGTVDAVATQFDLPPAYISKIVETLDLRELYRRKGNQNTYTNAELEAAGRLAAEIAGEPLTIPGYRVAAKAYRKLQGKNLPTDATIVKHYGDWQKFCKAAGIRSNPARGPRDSSIDQDTCVRALREYRYEKAEIPTYQRYCDWAAEQGQPSGPTVRNKCGSWTNALRLAFEPAARV